MSDGIGLAVRCVLAAVIATGQVRQAATTVVKNLSHSSFVQRFVEMSILPAVVT